MKRFFISLCLCLYLASGAFVSFGEEVFPQNIFSNVAEKVLAAAVLINNGAGTGFLISPDGYLITNRHVYDVVFPFKVRLYDGREFEGKLAKKSFATNLLEPDVALVKIDADNLSYLPIGNSDELKIGEIICVVGNFAGLSFNFSAGVIGGLHRKIPETNPGENFFGNYIQHSAVLHGGGSGGPVVNLKGEVVAVNSHIILANKQYKTWQGIAFAVPINDALKFLEYNERPK